MPKSYLITGATGFVGEQLALSLLSHSEGGMIVKNRVVTIAHDRDPAQPDVETVRGSVDDERVVRRALTMGPYDGIFHLAASAKVEACERNPLEAWETNVRGTYTLLEHAQHAGCPVVVASSDHAYGVSNSRKRPFAEADPFTAGGGIYDVSKSCADMIATCYGRSADVRVVRCGNIYGPTDRDMSRLIPSILDDLWNGRPPTIRSDGTAVREYIHVKDAVAGYRTVLTSGSAGEAYNFGGDRAWTVLQAVQQIVDVWEELRPRSMLPYRQYMAPAQSIQVLGTRMGDLSCLTLSDAKAQRLGWSTKVSLREGITEMIRDRMFTY